MMVGTKNVMGPKNLHRGDATPKAWRAPVWVLLPMATSVVSREKPKVSASTR